MFSSIFLFKQSRTKRRESRFVESVMTCPVEPEQKQIFSNIMTFVSFLMDLGVRNFVKPTEAGYFEGSECGALQGS